MHGIALDDPRKMPMALGMTSWKKWLAAPLYYDNNMPICEVVADCVYEMTWYGPDDDFQVWMGRRTGQVGSNLIPLAFQ